MDKMITFTCFICQGTVPRDVPVCLDYGDVYPRMMPTGTQILRSPGKRRRESAPVIRLTSSEAVAMPYKRIEWAIT